MKKIIQSIVFLVAIIPVIHATAQAPIVPDGDGTKGYPFQIGSLGHLYWIAVETNNGNAFPNKYFAQCCDIDASETTTWFPDGNGGFRGWNPIGRDAQVAFAGRYNGYGYKITNLYCHRPDEDRIGLFWRLNHATISNLKLKNFSITGHENVGGICSGANNSRFYQCLTDGMTAGVEYIGSLAGSVNQCEIFECNVLGTTSGSVRTGGMIGMMDLSFVRDCKSAVHVNGLSETGGLAAYSTYNNIIRCADSSTITGSFQVGGLSGYAEYDTISLSFSHGYIAGAEEIGGFAGRLDGCQVSDCYSVADVSGLSDIIGGFGGSVYETSIMHCYSAGSVELLTFPRPSNDFCYDAISIEMNSQIEGTTLGAYGWDWEYCGEEVTAPGVWYTFTGTGSYVTVNTCAGATFDTKISVFSSGCGELVCEDGNDDVCGLFSEVTISTYAGSPYFILVHGYGKQVGNFTLSLTNEPERNLINKKDDYYSKSFGSDQTKAQRNGQRSTNPDIGGFAGNVEDATFIGCLWDIEASGQEDGAGGSDPDPVGLLGKSSNVMKDISIYSLSSWDITYPPSDTTIWLIIDSGTEFVTYPYLASNPQNPPPGLEFIGISENREIEELTVNTGESPCLDAYNNIIAENITVEPGGQLTLIAGNMIRILPDSHIESGAYFRASITTNGIFCGGEVITLASTDQTTNKYDIIDPQNITVAFASGISIFPNPGNGIFNIMIDHPFHDNSNAILEIYSMLGNRIMQSEINIPDLQSIDFTTQQAGIYMIRVWKGNAVWIEKLIKQ